MTEQQVAQALAEMSAESDALERDGVLPFDGSAAWERLTKSMGAEVLAIAQRMTDSGDAGPPLLLHHLGTEG